MSHHTIEKQPVQLVEPPLCCPRSEANIWDKHPRVYLAADPSTGIAICPYCSAAYQVEKSHAHHE